MIDYPGSWENMHFEVLVGRLVEAEGVQSLRVRSPVRSPSHDAGDEAVHRDLNWIIIIIFM
jgi:hypothetical protein